MGGESDCGRDARGEQTRAGTQAKTSPMLSTREITDEGCMDSRPHERRAAEKCDELPLPHGIFPKAKDHKSSIAGLRVIQARA